MSEPALLEFMVEVAHRAGAELVARLEGKRVVNLKGRIDLVTDADHASEHLIVTAIRETYPGHRIISEEGGGIEQVAGFTWLIDPLDGTTNYAHGLPIFAVSIAVLRHDDVIAGVVYDPTRRELFWAERGAGAWLNGRRLRVSEAEHLSEALLTTGFPYNYAEQPDNNLAEFGRLQRHAQAIRRPGAAALDLAYLAAGRTEGHWELGLHPWDVAAGALLVREAGGQITDWQGGPWSHWNDRMLATNRRIHAEVLAVLRGGQ